MLTACLGRTIILRSTFRRSTSNTYSWDCNRRTSCLSSSKDFVKGETGLANDESVPKTISRPPGYRKSLTLCSLDPQGLVETSRAWMKSFLVFGMVPELPLYPTVPPVAITLAGDQLGWQGEVALPLETVQAWRRLWPIWKMYLVNEPTRTCRRESRPFEVLASPPKSIS